jgi:hypothetical protein
MVATGDHPLQQPDDRLTQWQLEMCLEPLDGDSDLRAKRPVDDSAADPQELFSGKQPLQGLNRRTGGLGIVEHREVPGATCSADLDGARMTVDALEVPLNVF